MSTLYREFMIRVAQKAAQEYRSEHSYTHVENFQPHEWVLRAMEQMREEGYSDGYSDAIFDESVRGSLRD